MPTYRNDTNRRITHYDMNYMEWKPGEEKRLSFFVPHELLGLTKIEDIPFPYSIVHTWTVQLTPGDPVTLDLPYHEAFELSIIAEMNDAEVRIGGGDEAFTVNQGEAHLGGFYTYAKCPSLTFRSGTSAILRVKQEEVTPAAGRAAATVK